VNGCPARRADTEVRAYGRMRSRVWVTTVGVQPRRGGRTRRSAPTGEGGGECWQQWWACHSGMAGGHGSPPLREKAVACGGDSGGRVMRRWRARSRVPLRENRATPPGRCGNRPLQERSVLAATVGVQRPDGGHAAACPYTNRVHRVHSVHRVHPPRIAGGHGSPPLREWQGIR